MFRQPKSTIGIFRALDVRFVHAEFAASFRELKSIFVANMTPEQEAYLTKEHVAFNNVPLTPRFFIDPVKPLLKKTDSSPWLEFDPQRLDAIIPKIDIFQIYEPYFFYSDQIARIAKKKQAPLVTEIWTSFPEHPSRYMVPYSFIVSNVLKKTDFIVLRSQRAEQFLKPYKLAEKEKAVIYHGVNIERFIPTKKDHEPIRILFVGALASHKGLDDVLAVFPRLLEKYPRRLELVICGDGPLRERVLRLAKDLPIMYKGQVSNLDLPHIYQSSDIYCQPSKDYYFFGIKGGEEFAGYTFMEAMACGLPLVSTYCGGIPEIVGDANLLVGQGNKEALFAALNKYIANPSLRQEIGQQNRERAEKMFNLTKQVAVLEKALQENLG